MDDLIARIAQADELEFERILKEVLERYNDLFPGWELCAVPFPSFATGTARMPFPT